MEIIAEQMDVDEIDSINEELQAQLEEAGISEAEILEEAREDIVLWDGYFGENMVRGKDDMNFVLRDQWTAVTKIKSLSSTLKPCDFI